MAFELLEVSAPGLAYIVLGGFAVVFSMVSLLVKERLYINEVVLGTGFGVLMGPHVANIFNPRDWGSEQTAITLEITRIVLATGLFAIGVELPQNYLAKHARGVFLLTVPNMAIGWLVVGGLLKGLFSNLSFVSCLAIAACLTPTDPIICASIVGGKFAHKYVPANLRHLLSAESAANDCLGYPFLTFALYLLQEKSPAEAMEKWFVIGIFYQICLSLVLGSVIGLAFASLMQMTQRKGFIDRESYVAQYLALVFLNVGVCRTLGVDDLLATFASGSAISWDGHFNLQVENEMFSSVLDLVLNCAYFVYVGAWLPFDAFNTPSLGITPWRLVILFIAILLVRRIPCTLAMYRLIPEMTTWREALFSGHFGPMGAGAIFFSTYALTRLPEPHSPPQNQAELLATVLQPIVTFVILGSILVHGLSIPFFKAGRGIQSRTLSLSRTLSINVNSTFSRTQTQTAQTLRGSLAMGCAPAPIAGIGMAIEPRELEEAEGSTAAKSTVQSPAINRDASQDDPEDGSKTPGTPGTPVMSADDAKKDIAMQGEHYAMGDEDESSDGSSVQVIDEELGPGGGSNSGPPSGAATPRMVRFNAEAS